MLNFDNMTNEQNFKKGDIVVYNGEHLHISEEIIKDDILTVYDVSQNGDKVWVKHPAVGKVDASELEMYLPYDRRTDFLRKLGALLREFDASIGYFIGDDEKYGWCDYPFLKIGDETIKYPAGEIDEITADNIMDFDKE